MLFILIMIGKISPKAIWEKILPPSLPTPQKEGSGFHSLLKEKIEDSAPLEKMALEFLRKAVALALWDAKTEETELFPSPSLFLPLKPTANPGFSPHPQAIETQPQLFAIEPEYEVSNNLPGEQDFEYIMQEAGQRYGVDPSLIKAVIQVESGGNPFAVSKAGARGLMQLMPETAAELRINDPFDPVQNIMGGTHYLRSLLNRYHGDVKLALAAYNWGMGNLERQPQAIPKETRNFVARVESLYRNSTKT